MKIKLAILDGDRNYLNRIVATMETKYYDKFQVYSFTEQTVALNTVAEVNIDVLVVSDMFEIDVSKLPKRCAFAYLVESADIETFNEQRAICKFQKIDLIYKQILGIFSENSGNVANSKITGDNCKIIAFVSPSGGVGSSSVAAACAIHFATQKRKTLYLNFEKFGSSDVFFSSEGQFDMSDIIFSLKSKKANLSMKLESCVKQDYRGVYFYSQTKVALDMMELGCDEIMRLISDLSLSGAYEYIILDIDFAINKEYLNLYHHMNAIVLVGDGSEISNLKTVRAITALSILEQNVEAPLINRMSLLYNKFSNKMGKSISEDIGLKRIGGAPKYEHATTAQVLDQLSAMNVFNDIV